MDCAVAHTYESIGSSATCTASEMVVYLGGTVGRDVLILAHPIRSGTDCLLRTPMSQTRSVRLVLQQGSTAAWRRCLDTKREAVVACSQPHTGEFLGAGDVRAPNASECATAVRAYMGTPYTAVQDTLTVAPLSRPGTDPTDPRCALSVRGSSVGLGVVLRDLGNATIDLVPR